MLKVIVVVCSFIFFSGCAKLAHLEELLRLKSLSENQAEQKKYVESQNKKFEVLLKTIHNGELSQYHDKKSIIKAFGEPIFTEVVEFDEQILEKWLYPYSEKLSGSEKVYLYFDTTGQCVNWQHFPAERKVEK